MALNNSGKISLAGSTAGESIAVELGKSPTGLISINDNDVRSLAGISTGIISLGDFYGKSSASYWIRSFSLAGVNASVPIIFSSPFGSDYLIFLYRAIVSTIQIQVIKIKFDGTIVFNKRIRGSYSDSYITNTVTPIIILPDNTFLLTTGQRVPTTNWPAAMVNKFDENMTTAIYSSFSSAGGNTATASMNYDPVNNIYCLGMSDGRGYQRFNASTGAFISGGYRRNGSGTGNGNNGYTGCFDSSGNLYASLGQCILKYNTSMNIVWGYAYDGASQHASPIKINDNKYIFGYGKVAFGSHLCCIDANGNVLWAKRTVYNSVYAVRPSIAKDSSGNIYAIAAVYNENYVNHIHKYDSYGNLIWQRTITSGQTTAGSGPAHLEIGTDGNMYVSYGLPNGRGFLFKLPSDGSLTGVYTIDGVTFTYAPSFDAITNLSITKVSYGVDIYFAPTTGSQGPIVEASAVTSNFTNI